MSARPAEPLVAPPWSIERWFNAAPDFGLERLRGRVVALHAFQMLCPGCVTHGIPQAQRIQATFSSEEVAVVGLHTVFEHHAAMTPVSLEAFLHEYRVSFPVGVDLPSEVDAVPTTMARYRLRGTPSLVLIDAKGRLRQHQFGRADDMAVGASIAALIAEGVESPASIDAHAETPEPAVTCSDGVCERERALEASPPST